MPQSTPSGISWISRRTRSCLATLFDRSGTECEKQGHGCMFTVVKGYVGMSGSTVVLFYLPQALSPLESFLCTILYSGRNQLLSCANRSTIPRIHPPSTANSLSILCDLRTLSKTTRKDEAHYCRPYWLGRSSRLAGCHFDEHFIDTPAVMCNKVYVLQLSGQT